MLAAGRWIRAIQPRIRACFHVVPGKDGHSFPPGRPRPGLSSSCPIVFSSRVAASPAAFSSHLPACRLDRIPPNVHILPSSVGIVLERSARPFSHQGRQIAAERSISHSRGEPRFRGQAPRKLKSHQSCPSVRSPPDDPLFPALKSWRCAPGLGPGPPSRSGTLSRLPAQRPECGSRRV